MRSLNTNVTIACLIEKYLRGDEKLSTYYSQKDFKREIKAKEEQG